MNFLPTIKRAFCLTFCLALVFFANSQALKKKWSVNPYENKEFIENKGQYTPSSNFSTDEILFGVNREGVQIYFTAKGLTYRHDKYSRQSRAQDARSGEEHEEELAQERKIELLQLSWLNANPDLQVVADEKLSWYNTFPDLTDKSRTKTLVAAAYKKIIYKDLYPHVDVEYFFPSNKPGIKYNLIIHPGADVSKIKMKYEGAHRLKLDKNGNLLIESEMGTLVDHAPQTFAGPTKISSAFEVTDNVVSFKIIGTYDNTQTLVIDPWVTNPVFVINKAYDVDYDKYGNVFAYGSAYPYQLVKLDNTGVILWKYSASLFTGGGSNYYYGDMAVDYNSGVAYLVEGFNASGSQVLKISPTGLQKAYFAGNTQMTEMWRINYNYCTKKTIIAGGGISGTNQACVLDSNLVNLVPVNVLKSNASYHDFSLLALDNAGACFFLAARSLSDPGFADNIILKCPAATLTPTTLTFNSNHAFLEVATIKYAAGNGRANGYNGMAVNNNFLCTYDGAFLKKWNKTTGTLINQITVSNDTAYTGGIDLSACDTLYVGVGKTIRKYDASLTLISTIPVPDSIFDVKLGRNQTLYACGLQYVTAIPISELCGVVLSGSTTTTSSCGSSGTGTATVNVSGGSGSYVYSWSPGGQTAQTAINLVAGNYTVSVSDISTSGCAISSPKIFTLTVTSIPINLNYTLSAGPVSCAGIGSATVTVSSGDAPYTYSWSNGDVGLTGSNLIAGKTYTVTVTDSLGCPIKKNILIPKNNPITVSLNSPSVCKGGIATLTATASGGSGSFSYSWSPNPISATGSSANVSPVITTSYTVTVTDANGCTETTAGVVTILQPPSAIFTADPLKGPKPLTVNFTNGSTGATSYLWTFGDPSFPVSILPNPKSVTFPKDGKYVVTLIASNGCLDSMSVTIIVEGISTLTLPNVFSPNGDNKNDLFIPSTEGIETLNIEIYDRWGLKMSEITTVGGSWNGKATNGKDAPDGTYYYVLKAHGIDSKDYNLTGFLTLIR